MEARKTVVICECTIQVGRRMTDGSENRHGQPDQALLLAVVMCLSKAYIVFRWTATLEHPCVSSMRIIRVYGFARGLAWDVCVYNSSVAMALQSEMISPCISQVCGRQVAFTWYMWLHIWSRIRLATWLHNIINRFEGSASCTYALSGGSLRLHVPATVVGIRCCHCTMYGQFGRYNLQVRCIMPDITAALRMEKLCNP
jgi:hypothetical protein